MNTVYLIDSENVNDAWVELLPVLDCEDKIIVFYTDKSPHMCYQNVITLLNNEKKIEFIKCFEGNNALDFQLVTELGYMLCDEPENSYVIVSNDTGFDAIVKYWKKKELKVSRIKGKECRKEAQKINGDDVQLQETVEENPVDTCIEEAFEEGNGSFQDMVERGYISEDEIECVDDLIKIVPLKNMTLLHNALTCMLGQSKGDLVYTQIKENKNQYIEYQRQFVIKKKERERSYIQLVLKQNNLDEMEAADLQKWLDSVSKKNLNELHIGIVKKYGHVTGGKYYSAIKKHLKIINKL